MVKLGEQAKILVTEGLRIAGGEEKGGGGAWRAPCGVGGGIYTNSANRTHAQCGVRWGNHTPSGG